MIGRYGTDTHEFRPPRTRVIDGRAGDDRINVVGGGLDIVTCGAARTPCSRRRATS